MTTHEFPIPTHFPVEALHNSYEPMERYSEYWFSELNWQIGDCRSSDGTLYTLILDEPEVKVVRVIWGNLSQHLIFARRF